VKQVLLNLCFNAIQAVETQVGERWVQVATRNTPAGIEMSVSDSWTRHSRGNEAAVVPALSVHEIVGLRTWARHLQRRPWKSQRHHQRRFFNARLWRYFPRRLPMPTLVILATTDTALADTWERQLPPGRTALRLLPQAILGGTFPGFAAVVILDAAAEANLPGSLLRCPTIFVGEPRSLPFEQAKISGRAKIYLSYDESGTRLREFLPLVEEVAEKQSMLDLLLEKSRRTEVSRPAVRAPAAMDAAELWDFLEGAVENLDTRERLIAEFRRATRHLLRASHAVFFIREAQGFRADRGTSFLPENDPLVAFLENHPVVIDGTEWEGPADPVAELAVAQPAGAVGRAVARPGARKWAVARFDRAGRA